MDAEALEFARASEEMNPNNGDAHASLGDLYRKTDRPRAIREYELAVKDSPATWQYLRRLAGERFQDHRYAEAADLYRRATKYASWFGGVWVGLADSLAATGDLKGAIDALDHAQKGLMMDAQVIVNKKEELQKRLNSQSGVK
jgi:tetratricopeptide (TPR) repeat protein